ncbi:uncharacterized protein LOC143034348 [Oratosquilla oratoria]|uniref:uncharacterized protein LOC143034348 n=1 Tax=Oratosquilla oratoria TaxID=337810 RepID=UPI003F764AE4
MRVSIVILVICLTAFSSATLHLCRCGLFSTGEFGEYMTLELPGLDVPSCEYKHTCEGRCIDEFNTITSNGNLYAPIGDSTVGQKICDVTSSDPFWLWPIDRCVMHLYYEICNGPWRYTGKHSMQMLCCDDNGKQYVCA